MVLGGELHPGDRVNEVALAEQLGISRGPLREAIQRLAADGLLTVLTHRGAFVPTIGEDELRDLYELRAVLETAAVRLGVARASDAQLAQVRAELTRAGRLLRGTGEGGYPSEVDIHRLFVSLCGNTALAAMTADVHTRITLARARSGSVPERARAAHREHVAILTRMRSRDADGAARLMRAHLEAAGASALRRLHDEGRGGSG